ncbi:MAG TPA: hypothetical protein VMV45_21035 [Casimicrobiaceae bacterium]|nr:hypothetical protein [Casimicrobiaceae bacterium]
MPVTGAVPEAVVTLLAAATLFTVMFSLGIGVGWVDFRWAGGHARYLAKGLFCVLVAAPAIALLVARVLGLSREAEIGVVLMAIAPGAPIALRRSVDAGGHRSFAPALQILLALLAVVSMPASIAALDELYAGTASIAPWDVAKQVFVAQLLPIGLGMLFHTTLPAQAVRLAPHLARISKVLLALLVIVVLVDVSEVVVRAGSRIALSIGLTTIMLLAVGHWFGGPERSTRTAVAISSAMRNPGLALLVATVNGAPAVVIATVLAYVVVSAFIVLPYVLWQRRRASQRGEQIA